MGKNRRVNSRRKIKSKRLKPIKISKDEFVGILQGAAITVAIAALFYRSVFGLMVGIVVIPFWLKQYKFEREMRLVRRRKLEFKEYMLLIAGSLQTGYSIEKALRISEDELRKLFGKNSVLINGVHEMNSKIAVNVQVEKAFENFAEATGLEEAKSLSEILAFSKRCGGDYGKMIRNTALKLDERLSVEQEIETLTAQKRLELKVMSAMPLFILAYIALTSISFIKPLYGNFIGITIMTLCLIAYGFLIKLGKKIITIDV